MHRGRARVLKISAATFAVFFVGALAGWQFTQAWAAREATEYPLRNFGVVWENKLTRSGMPRSDLGWQWLRQHGTESIVTFRKESDVDYGKFGFQRVMRLPLGSDPPTDEQAEKFLRFIQDPANQPVHIHCTAGRDRTGMMTALTRYSIDGWALDRALGEAKAYRSGKDLSTKRVQWLKRWAARHQPGSFRLNN
jgi:uncharacterized membrane protein